MLAQRYGILLNRVQSLSDRQFAISVAGIVLAGMLIVFLPLSLLGMRQVITNGEVLDTQKEVGRVRVTLGNELDHLEKVNRDWSLWDDTYQFAKDGNQQYVSTNLIEPTLSDLGVNLFVIARNDGQVLAVRDIDLTARKFQNPPFDVNGLLRHYPALLQNDQVTSTHKGLVVFGGQAMLVSSEPILTSLGQGPVSASLIMATYLDAQERQALSALAQRELDFRLYGTGDVTPTGSDVAIRIQDETTAVGYQTLMDIDGRPAVVLQVKNPRELYQQGLSITYLYFAAYLVVGLILTALTYWLVLSYIRSRRRGRQALERLSAIFAQSDDAILLVDGRGQILDANPAGLRMFKLEPGAARGASIYGFLTDGENLPRNPFNLSGCSGHPASVYLGHLSDGTRMDLEVSVSEIHDLGFEAYSTILRDVSDQREQKALRASEARYELATRGANDGLWDWDLLTDHIYYSARWKAMLGYGEAEIADRPDEWLGRVHPEDQARLRERLGEYLNRRTEHFECEHRVLHRDGTYRWMLARGVTVWDAAGTAQRMAGSQTDVTERRRIEEQHRYEALHDVLTGLGNRAFLLERLNRANERQRQNPKQQFAVLFLDLDRFKRINDGYGHQAGDQVLVETARRLEASVRETDTVARLNDPETLVRIAGDEFVILLEGLHDGADAGRSAEGVAGCIAECILRAVAQPYDAGGQQVTTSASIGIVVPERAYERTEHLLRDADIAMYEAKRKGGSTYVCFAQRMYDAVAARLRLESELRHGAECGEFVLHYQPIYALADNHMTGFEALLRWVHPRLGLLSPKDFMDLAEETGVIIPIGYRTLREACNQMACWQREYAQAGRAVISINLSARQLADHGLPAQVKRILLEACLAPECLWLEITETALIEKFDLVKQTLGELRELGIHIVIDDFGLGYSSLGYLHDLPVDGFKIDRSFVSQIPGGERQIVDTLVDLGKRLKLTLVAEGVETVAQKEYLETLGCEYMQGFLMAEPMSSERVGAFFAGAGGCSSIRPQTPLLGDGSH